MDINSAVKRNNPVWNANTQQEVLTLPAAPGMTNVMSVNSVATYVMITNGSGATIDIHQVSGGSTGSQGIRLAPGATFEMAVDLSPGGTDGMFLAGAGGETITVTTFVS